MKSIHNLVPATELPLPDDLLESIQAYLDKHLPIDDGDSQRLQDELLTIWQKLAKDKPERYTLFISILRELRPAIRGAARWLQWWDTLVIPVLAHIGEERGLSKECRLLLLDILVFEAEDADNARIEAAQQTSLALSEKILEMWLNQCSVATTEADPAAHYMEQQVKIVLMSFGQKRPQVGHPTLIRLAMLTVQGIRHYAQQILCKARPSKPNTLTPLRVLPSWSSSSPSSSADSLIRQSPPMPTDRYIYNGRCSRYDCPDNVPAAYTRVVWETSSFAFQHIHAHAILGERTSIVSKTSIG